MTKKEAIKVIKCHYPTSKHYYIWREALDMAVEELEKSEALTKELKDMKKKAYSFLNQDYATGYISAISTIEGFMGEKENGEVE